jgi:c-di-GMP-binding flagellar brake protein YcgR
MTYMHRAPPDLEPQLAPTEPPSETPAERRRSRADRRRAPRRQVVVAVRQEVVGSPVAKPELHLAQSSDLALGGMRVWRHCGVDEPELKEHTTVRLAFQLPDDLQLLEVDGEVVFDRSPAAPGEESRPSYRATGVRFSAVPDEVLARLRTFLED